jgi:hypothetical protein
VTQAEYHRRDDAQRAYGLVVTRHHHLLDIFELVEDLTGAFEIDLTGFGEGEAAGRAVEQTRAKPAFQVGDVTRCNRIGDIHRRSGPGETAEVRHFDEYSHRLQMIHETTPACYLSAENRRRKPGILLRHRNSCRSCLHSPEFLRNFRYCHRICRRSTLIVSRNETILRNAAKRRAFLRTENPSVSDNSLQALRPLNKKGRFKGGPLFK